MGVHGLWQLLQPAGKPIPLEMLEGKVLAVDVSIWLNKAAKGMRDKSGNPVHNAHLIVIFHRICKLLFYKVKPIFVFDGGVPELKKKTIAIRRERKITAEGKAYKASKKILHNYLKGKALETVTGKRGTRNVNPSRQEIQDLFQLPPMPIPQGDFSSSESEDNVDVEAEWISEMRSENVEKMLEDITTVDMDAEDFQNLTPEIQHELLIEMKDSYRRRYNRRKSQQMPENANEFSDFQLKNLFRRGKITQKIDDVRKEMKSKSSGEIGGLDEESFLRKNVKTFEASRVASEDKKHYIFFKKDNKKGKNILFNSSLETSHSEIYQGIKRKENFDRLEREPIQLNSSSIDRVGKFDFMSDSTEESDFDEDFSPKEAEKFRIIDNTGSDVNRSNEIVVTENSINQAFETVCETEKELSLEEAECIEIVEASSRQPADQLSPDLSAITSKEKQHSGEQNAYFPQESSSDVVENLSSEDINDVDSKISNYPRASDSGSESGLGEVLNDAEDGTANDVKLDQGLEIEPVPMSEAIVTENQKELVLVEENVSGELQREPRAVEKPVSSTDDISTVVKESSQGTSRGEQFVNVDSLQFQSDSSIDDDIDNDISAIPKPENLNSNVGEKEDRQLLLDDEEFQQFKSTIQDCQSEEQVSAVQRSLQQEQNELLRERDRQSRAAASVGNEEYTDVQELLRLFGIPFITSPMEAEAQCAILDITKQTDGSITDDSDILLFGGTRVYKNIFNQDRYAELFLIENIMHTLFLDREKMIALAYLTGSDYTEGIHGIGVITAMEILQEFGGAPMEALTRLKTWFERVKASDEIDFFQRDTKLQTKLRSLELPKSFPNHRVWSAYIDPTVDYSKEPFEWGRPDLGAIREYARAKFGWPASRTDDVILPVMKQLNDTQSQTSLRRFFTSASQTTTRAVSSKRLQRTVNLMRAGVSGGAERELSIARPEATAAAIGHEEPLGGFPSSADDQSSQPGNAWRTSARKASYKKQRVPTMLEFRKRVIKSKQASRGRKRFRASVMSANDSPKKAPIAKQVLDLSGSSSDSD